MGPLRITPTKLRFEALVRVGPARTLLWEPATNHSYLGFYLPVDTLLLSALIFRALVFRASIPASITPFLSWQIFLTSIATGAVFFFPDALSASR